MKKLFTMLVVLLCGTMAYAQTDVIKMSDVKLKPGTSETLYVTINEPTKYTAFQFDLKLPKGVSVKDDIATIGGTSSDAHVIRNGVLDAASNTYRFLVYDMKNATFGQGATVKITLDASSEVKDGTILGTDILFVDPNGASTTQESASANVSASENVEITIGDSKKTTFVGNYDLDFTGNDARAYIVMGAEKVGDGVSLWLAQIDKVPAGTPIVVKADNAGTYSVKKTTIANTYYKSFLVGNNSDSKLSVTPEGTDLYYFLSTSGFAQFTSTKEIGAHKAYVRVPALPAANAGNGVEVTLGSGKRTSLCTNVDLDFSKQSDLTAYIVVGWDGSIMMAPVEQASAGTPLYIKGPEGKFTIPSSAAQLVYSNMLVGNNTDASIHVSPTSGEFTNYFLSTSGFSKIGDSGRDISAHKSYLQVLTTYVPSVATARDNFNVLSETVLKATVDGNEGDEATGINRVAVEAGNDAWFNLSGQRISTPTKKGLYIHNGKKVIVK